ncbi:hypothetical protein FC764_14020 [Clostridium botulinum]|uniref:Pentapeptide repeat-containing protein n=1 Tax=Clostridium aquiflavi TaxID=3073603 RepID=A0ABU1EDE4_9CLOT|nr:pentapeptide repeat-containing protein [Clostridium sp. 5N-1]MDR5586392.1 pentapeptide repeat-containing protein [Clostridium sp. 5N-1]NFF82335.1 hypothetical protein [Clostridium botulinum]
MQQYYIGKLNSLLNCLRNNVSLSNLLFFNDSLDKSNSYIYEHIYVERSTFSKISFFDCTLKHIDFSHCVFIDCYFNKCIFSHINFENCKFIDCSFNKISLNNCVFFYTEWESNYIKFNDLYNCLPEKYNNRSRLCKVMAKNCIADGNIAEYRKYFFENIHSREKHYREIILRRTDFYKSEYTLRDLPKTLLKLLCSKLNGLIWGHGEKISNILYSSIFIILLFTFIYVSNSISNTFISALYISLCNFLTISSDITFSESFYRYATTIEGFLGIAFMGLFVTALFKNINSR